MGWVGGWGAEAWGEAREGCVSGADSGSQAAEMDRACCLRHWEQVARCRCSLSESPGRPVAQEARQGAGVLGGWRCALAPCAARG